ncbi:Hypothetical predicted protein [Mytilus galloprovincialis]|uniref:Uncharacterized protein n=1 Tax=Mytilus galloprovincialis TaxID=29158 RepID=A0A8B6C1A3_MYTGA|nr:Hypothetical predicted protein [Mytilus galloprovincialis]
MKFAIATVAILVCLCGMKGIHADDYYGSLGGGVQGYGSSYGKGGYGSSYGGHGGSMGGYDGYSGYGKGQGGYSSYGKKEVHGYGKQGGYIDETIHRLSQPVPMSGAGSYAGGISSYGGSNRDMLSGIFGGGKTTKIRINHIHQQHGTDGRNRHILRVDISVN